MIYRTSKLVKPGDLNPENTLFGGRLLEWLDEECAIFAMNQLGTRKLRTKAIGEIVFLAPAHQGDIVEIGVSVAEFGVTSITIRACVRNFDTGEIILTLEKIVMVSVDETGNKVAHGITAGHKIWKQFSNEPYPFKERPHPGLLLDHWRFVKNLSIVESLKQKSGLDIWEVEDLLIGKGVGDIPTYTAVGEITGIDVTLWLLAEFEYHKQEADKACKKAAGTT
jgi:acyl-CoA thioesterase YciA